MVQETASGKCTALQCLPDQAGGLNKPSTQATLIAMRCFRLLRTRTEITASSAMMHHLMRTLHDEAIVS